MFKIHKNFKISLILLILFIFIISFSNNVYATDDIFLINSTRVYFCSQITKGYGNGDCILLENYDHFGNKTYGLIDTGRNIPTKDSEGNDSTVVVDFLKNHGVTKLDFLVITHSHIDHNGDAVSVINSFNIDRIYMKEYDGLLVINDSSQDSYEKVLEAAINKDIKVIGVNYLSIISENYGPSRSDDFINNYVPFAKEENFESFYYNSEEDNNVVFNFGSSELRLFNWEMFDINGNQYFTGISSTGREIVINENNNSLGILLSQGFKKAFFAGDINNLDYNAESCMLGDEDRIKDYIGDVDFLKLGHHGYEYSSTENFMNVLRPEYAVITNDEGEVYSKTIEYLENNNVNYLYSTQNDYEVVVTITQNGIYMGNGIPNTYIEEQLAGDITTSGAIINNSNAQSNDQNVENIVNTDNQIEIINSAGSETNKGSELLQVESPKGSVSSDRTTATVSIPNTGKSIIILFFVLISIAVAVVFYFKTKKYNV